jgi:hypothetical protein
MTVRVIGHRQRNEMPMATMRRLVLSSALAATLGAPGSAAANVPTGLSWSAPPSCLSREAALARLRQTGDPQAAPSPMDVNVTITQEDDDRWRARVEIVAGHAWTERSIEAASSCDAIADAVLIIVGVAAASTPATPPGVALPPSSTPPSPAARDGVAPSALSPGLPERRDVFGHPSQLVVSTDLQASFEWGNSSSDPRLLVAPAADLFLAHHFSVGVILVYEHFSNDTPLDETVVTSQATVGTRAPFVVLAARSSERIGAGARLGYHVRFADWVSLWPTVGATLEHAWFGADFNPGETGVFLDAYAPVLFHVVPHFFVGFGPALDTVLGLGESASPRAEFGLRLTVGGWAHLGG